MTKLPGLALAAVFALAVAGVACGGGDDGGGVTPTLTAAASVRIDTTTPTALIHVTENVTPDPSVYFQAAAQIASGTMDALNSISDHLTGQTFTTDADEIAANKDATQQTAQVLQIGYEHLQELHPPADAADANQALVQAMTDYADVTNRISAALGGITTKAQFESVKQQFGVETSSKYSAYDDACRSLEGRGKDVIAGYDIHCPIDNQQ